MRGWILLAPVVTAAMLVGCSTDDPDPERPSETVTEPPREYTIEELRAALPEVDDVDGATEIAFECPGDERCGELDEDAALERVSITLRVLPAGDEEEIERRASDSWIEDGVHLAVILYEDAAEAQETVDDWLDAARVYDGDFDEELEELDEDSFIPGERGTGLVDDAVEVGGWSGFAVESTYSMVGPSGDESPPLLNHRVVVSHGAVVVNVESHLTAEGRDEDEATAWLRSIVEDYLARLDS